MEKIIFGIILVALLLAILAAITLYAYLGSVVALTQQLTALSAGLKKKSVIVDGYTVHYYEGGTGDVVMLLHGMADEKNSFAATAGQLTGQYRVILPDLLGHGENVRDRSQDYSIHGHVIFLHKFIAELGIETLCLGGNSMGGHISAAYTLAYPEQVTKLILVNAPGITLDDHVVYGGFGDKMQSREDFYAVMDRVVYRRLTMPGPIVDYMIKMTNADFDFINSLAESVKQGKDYDLKDRIADITVPTLIVWGKHDEVVKFNVAEAYNALISNSQLIVIEGASHSPQMEKSVEIGQTIDEFLAG